MGIWHQRVPWTLIQPSGQLVHMTVPILEMSKVICLALTQGLGGLGPRFFCKTATWIGWPLSP